MKLSDSWKCRLVSALCMLVLLPILPLYLLRASAQALVIFLDWAVEGRAWSQPFVRASERIELYFRVDSDTEYAAWQQRMRDKPR